MIFAVFETFKDPIDILKKDIQKVNARELYEVILLNPTNEEIRNDKTLQPMCKPMKP